MVWLRGLEPRMSRITIWSVNPYRPSHHNTASKSIEKLAKKFGARERI
jgi:hypothetical protein